jgi:hypothetical protein
MSGRIVNKTKYDDKNNSKKTMITTHCYSVSNVQLNPDFEALNAFKIKFPEGTPVRIGDTPGISYVWKNGRAVPKFDKRIIAAIDKEVDKMRLNGTIPLGLGIVKDPNKFSRTKLKDVNSRQVNPSHQNYTNRASDDSQSNGFGIWSAVAIFLPIAITGVWFVTKQKKI